MLFRRCRSLPSGSRQSGTFPTTLNLSEDPLRVFVIATRNEFRVSQNERACKTALSQTSHFRYPVARAVDVLVNNAGYRNVAPIEHTTLGEFRAQIETNLFGVIILTKAVLPYFRGRGSGHIMQVTSIAGRIGPIGRAPYAAAKWGVEDFSETLAKEVGPLGVKVTIVEPGGFRMDFAGSSTELREGRVPNTMRRWVKQRASSTVIAS